MSTAPDAPVAFGFGTPWADQIDYLRNKLNLPTQRWDDIMRSAHDRAFIVAGAQKADLLNDLHAAMVKAAEGGGLKGFQKNFSDIVAKHGWTGWTGEGSKAGEAWRTKMIYTTNMTTSYAAGRYQQLTHPDSLEAMPYWRCIHADGILNPRLQHLAWHGLTLLHDHPFWKTHFFPCGFHCHCYVVGVTKQEGLRSAKAGLGEPPDGWDKIDPATGEQVGIGKGWGYAPGSNTDTSLRDLVQNKLISYPDAIGKALAADVGRYINASEQATAFATRALVDTSVNEPLWLGFVENHEDVTAVAKVDVKGYLVTLPSDTPRHVQASHGNDGNGQRPAVPADYENVLDVLTSADTLEAGRPNRHGGATVVATKRIGQEVYRAVFEVLSGKKNKALALLSLVIKT